MSELMKEEPNRISRPLSVADEAYERYVSTKIGDVVGCDEKSLNRFARTYAHYLRDWLPPAKDAAILDVGCGHGNMLYSLKAWGYTRVAGLDRSAEQVSLARRLHPEAIEADALQYLAQHPNSYDVVLAIDLFEHLSLDQARQFLKDCHTALRTGGRLIMQLPNAGSVRGGELVWGDITHCRAYSAPAIQQFLKLTGFVQIEFRETGPAIIGLRSLLRLILWSSLRTGLRAFDLIEGGRASPIQTRTFLVRTIKGTQC
ncbi:MAG: class I SAM-dependent methyltransferase [Verrucomicrobia bacterium]|nr:class I SAM-dependent methyltransferase [Verrucomicrobiota bacterium]